MVKTHKLLILSDSHIFGSRDQELFGVNPYHSLSKLAKYIRGLGLSFDLAIALGDLSEDGHTRSYEDFSDLTNGLATFSVWMQGNHDQFDRVPGEMTRDFIHHEWHMDPWSIIFLDSTIPRTDEGELSEIELQRLETFLQTNKERFVLIFMHHQPVEVDSHFIDLLGLQNKQKFWEVTLRYQHIKAVIFGHVHQEFERQYYGIRLLSTPSTTVQFKPHSHVLDFDTPTHGYRTIMLNPDGSFDTKVERIAASGP